jgi:hypothetical protein
MTAVNVIWKINVPSRYIILSRRRPRALCIIDFKLAISLDNQLNGNAGIKDGFNIECRAKTGKHNILIEGSLFGNEVNFEISGPGKYQVELDASNDNYYTVFRLKNVRELT